MVDRDLVLRKLAELETYLAQLAEYRDLTARSYTADWKTQRIVDRTLHLAIEVCMDVADHLVADRRLRVPSSGTETFSILSDAGLLPPALAASLGRMVGFRNILVHDYTRVDPAVVVGAVREDVRDLRAFRDIVVALVSQEG